MWNIIWKGKDNMLNTNLKHLETEEESKEVLGNNENVMICCGRMGPMCIPVYGIMEQLEDEYSCLLYTSPSPRDGLLSRMPSSA